MTASNLSTPNMTFAQVDYIKIYTERNNLDYASDSKNWKWIRFPYSDFYYHHVKVSPDCTDEKCTNEGNDCIVYCNCSGCKKTIADVCTFPLNEKNGHCIYCSCEDCVCPMRRENGQYESVPIFPHWDNLCGGQCYICS